MCLYNITSTEARKVPRLFKNNSAETIKDLPILSLIVFKKKIITRTASYKISEHLQGFGIMTKAH